MTSMPARFTPRSRVSLSSRASSSTSSVEYMRVRPTAGLARGSWHPDAGPQERLPYADWDLAMHAVALAAKERVLSDPCADDQIATRSSEWTGIPFPGDANLRSGVDAGGHADDDRFDDAADTAAEARRASRPVAGAARATLRTGREPLHVQPDARPPNHPGERQLDDGMDIIAAPAFRQRVVDPGRVPESVVHLTGVRIAEHSERFRDLLEELAGPLVPEVDIGRVLPREALIGSAHLARRGGRRDAQNCVIVATHRRLLLLVA